MLIAFLLAASAVVQAQPAPADAGPVPVQRVRRQAPPPAKVIGDSAVIQLDLSSDIPVFAAEVGGKKVKLAFDTGARGPLRLSDPLAQELGLLQVGEARTTDPSGRNPVNMALYSLNSAKIGGLEISDWIATGGPVRTGKLAGLDGIIGLGAFNGFVVTLNYASGQLEIRRGSLPPADGKTIFEYRDDPIPNLPLKVDGKIVNAHLDTGNIAGPVIVPEQLRENLGQSCAGKGHWQRANRQQRDANFSFRRRRCAECRRCPAEYPSGRISCCRRHRQHRVEGPQGHDSPRRSRQRARRTQGSG